jgi:hypothetical protein
MVSQMEYAHFQAFGFVVLRGLLSKAEASTLKDEITAALAGAYGQSYLDDTSDFTEVASFDLPMMAASTPFARSLVADDVRFWQASHHLLGTASVPTQGEATCFRYNTKWHMDMPLGIEGVKFLVYPDACSVETGQLQVLPGSHRPDAHQMYWSYLQQDPERQGLGYEFDAWPVPAFGVDTEPGDAIAFHTNLMHASVGGERRHLWDIYYFADAAAAGGEHSEVIRDMILHMGNYGDMPFDREAFPVWRDWAASAAKSGPASTALARLERLGVLGVPGADLGRPKWEPRQARALLGTGSPATRRSGRR